MELTLVEDRGRGNRSAQPPAWQSAQQAQQTHYDLCLTDMRAATDGEGLEVISYASACPAGAGAGVAVITAYGNAGNAGDCGGR